MDVAYLQVAPHDAALFERVAEGVFDLPLEPSRIAAYLAAPLHRMVVALVDGMIVGQICAVIHHHPDKPSELSIDEIAVAEDFRRRGIGKALLDRMLVFAKDQGCEEAWLGTELHNQAARALYEPRASTGDPYLLYVFSIDLP